MDAKEIKEIRAKLGMSQVAFGNAIGVSPISVARWETGGVKALPLAVARIKELASTTKGKRI